MRRLVLLGLAPLALATAAVAQPADPHAGHHMPSAAPQSAPPPVGPHAGHAAPDVHDGQAATAEQGQAEIPKSQAPSPPGDFAAERFYPPEAMAAARAQLSREHGGAAAYSSVMAKLLERQVRHGADGYRWDAEAWLGGDVRRLVVRSEGEATSGRGGDRAEVRVLYSHAVGVYTDLQAGLRQDFEPLGRTYATVGFETLAPYWLDIGGAAFLSTKGDLLGRLEGSHDLRLTNSLILQSRAELNFAAQDTPSSGIGSGLSDAELGLRLRYELRRGFAPYVGFSWERKVGRTADFARDRGEDVDDRSVVIGLRAFL
jgi:copper resistance protein B